MPRSLPTASLTLVALAAWSAPALAAPQTQITSPANGTVLTYDGDNPSAAGNKITVTGTSNIISGTVNIRCYRGGTGTSVSSSVFKNSVATDGSGNFTSGLNSFNGITNALSCVLRAVPGATPSAGQEPGSTTTNFLGPILLGGSFSSNIISGSSVPENNGKVYNYFAQFGQMKGKGQFSPFGACALNGAYVYDARLSQMSNSMVFNCNAFVWDPTNLQVDGAPSFNPVAAANRPFTNSPCCPEDMNVVGLPNLTRSWSVDPATGNVTIQETDPIVRYDEASGIYLTAGVQLQRMITSDANGLRFTITDHWSSTDGKSHAIKVGYEDDFRNMSGDDAGFRFPWDPANSVYASHSPGDVIAAPPWSVTYFVRRGTSLADDDPANIHGAVTLSSPPDRIVFSGTRSLQTQYIRTIPATGTLDLTFIYADGFSDAQTSALVLAQQDAFSAPVVKFTAPPDGTVLANPNVTLTGTAADNVGLASFQLNGADLPVSATGDWSKAVVLKPGPNTFTAVAKDGAGNTTQAVETVTYAPDVTPPKLGIVPGKLSLKRLLASGGLTETVSCDEPCNIGAWLAIDSKVAKKLHVSRALTIAAGQASLTAPGKVALVVKLKPKALKALRKAKPKTLKLTLKNVATDKVGNATTSTKTLTLKK
jgi:hypothetical protein